MMPHLFVKRLLILSLGTVWLAMLAGCPVPPAPEPTTTDLSGYWMTVERRIADIDGDESSETDLDTDFLQLSLVDASEGVSTYAITHPCQPGIIEAYARTYDGNIIEIEDLESGASLRAALDDDDADTLRALDYPEDAEWTAQRVEQPPCSAADENGYLLVGMAPLELADVSFEGAAYWEDEEEIQAKAIRKAGLTRKDPPNGMTHLTESLGSLLTMGDEYGPKPTGSQSSNCVSDGAPVTCSPTGGHPGYIECATQGMSAAKIVELADVAALIDTDQVYPGALLQGHFFDGGSFVPVTIPRAGGTITMGGLFGTGANFSRTVDSINYANITNAITSILSDNKIEGTAANASYRVDSAYSSSEWAFQLGTDVKTVGVTVSGKVDAGGSSESNTVVMMFTQVFFTVSFQDPARRFDVFADGEQFDDPEGQIGSGNPPIYVSNVKYGRQVFLFAKSSLGSHYVKAALKGAYNGVAATVTVDSGMSYKDVMKNTSITYVVRGGDAGLALGPLQSATPDQMYDAIRTLLANPAAATWSAQNPGIPVAYTLRRLDNRQVAMKGLSTTYDQRDCHTVGAAQYQFRLAVNDINNDVTALVDGRTVFYHKGGAFNELVNPWIPADGRDHELRVVLGNGDCFTSHGNFSLWKEGAIVWGPYGYHPWGWQLCSNQVDIRWTVNPTTGRAQQSYFWHRH